MRRVLPSLVVLLLVAVTLAAAGCSYESSGITTTTVADLATEPPSTNPADLVFEDQMVEGSVVVIASVTLPCLLYTSPSPRD